MIAGIGKGNDGDDCDDSHQPSTRDRAVGSGVVVLEENREDSGLNQLTDADIRMPAAVVPGSQLTSAEWQAYAQALFTGMQVQPGDPIAVQMTNFEQMPLIEAMARAAADQGSTLTVLEPRGSLSSAELLESAETIESAIALDASFVSLTSVNGLYADELHPEELLAKQDSELGGKLREQRQALYAQSFGQIDRAKQANSLRWSLAPCPTSDWARGVFPDISPNQATRLLSTTLAKAILADKPPEVLREQQQSLRRRAELITEKAQTIEITGPGTNLRMRMATGSKVMPVDWETTQGKSFSFNVPSQEVFGTPAVDSVQGTATTTKPIRIGKTVIAPGVVLEFEQGRIVSVQAKTEAETSALLQIINSERKTDRVGELGFVDSDNLIAQSGVDFLSTLMDEQFGMHLGIGSNYSHITGGAGEASSEKSLGHYDLTIGSKQVSVVGISNSGERMTIIDCGSWAI